MSLTVANLLTEYKLAIRNNDESDSNCYAALNSVKDEAIIKILDYLKGSALKCDPPEQTITLVADTYTYSVAIPTVIDSGSDGVVSSTTLTVTGNDFTALGVKVGYYCTISSVDYIITAVGTTTVTLASAPGDGTVTYSIAPPDMGYPIEVKTNNGLGGYYVEMKRHEGYWAEGMWYDIYHPEYRFDGNRFEIKAEPTGGNYVKIKFLGAVDDVSSTFPATNDHTWMTDECDRMWAWYAAARHFENKWEDKEAARCYKIFNQKLFGTQRGF